MSKFVNTVKKMNDEKRTENGAKAYKTTGGGAVLDLFSVIGRLRNDVYKVVEMWKAARNEDKELADNMILYARDIRNTGLGERNIGKVLLKELAKVDPKKVVRNFDTIVSCGRWDDLFVLFNTPLENDVLAFIKESWKKDLEGMRAGKEISLLAKWLPSINTSSAETRAQARLICGYLNLTPRVYRKSLSAMRKYLNVVEKQMSAKEWDEINFEAVPSVAMNRYQNCFSRNCESFADYKASLVKGEAKVNAGALFPYDICMKYFTENGNFSEVDEAQWKALPNYVDDEYSVLVMADVSGSMTTDRHRPIATSVGLATYFAQHNKGAYKNLYMTFTDKPQFIEIEDSWSLKRIFDEVNHRGVGYSTNLDRAFSKVYDVAVESGEAPDAFVVISDCEIDYYVTEKTSNIIDNWDMKFRRAGFDGMPKVIFWNVESSRGVSQLAKAYQNISYVSGYGVGPFANLNSLITLNAYEAMVEILSKPAFAWK